MDIRIVLTEADLCELVQGKAIIKQDLARKGDQLKMVLEDVGFDRMAAIVRAAASKAEAKNG